MATGYNEHYGSSDQSSYFYNGFYTQPINISGGSLSAVHNEELDYRVDSYTGGGYATFLQGTGWTHGILIGTSPFTVSISVGGVSSTGTAIQSTSKTGETFYFYTTGALYNNYLDYASPVNSVSDDLSYFVPSYVASDIYEFTYGGTVTPDGTSVSIPVLWNSKYRNEPYKTTFEISVSD